MEKAKSRSNQRRARLGGGALWSTTRKLAGTSVVDPYHIDTDPDSTHHPEADPDADRDSDIFI